MRGKTSYLLFHSPHGLHFHAQYMITGGNRRDWSQSTRSIESLLFSLFWLAIVLIKMTMLCQSEALSIHKQVSQNNRPCRQALRSTPFPSSSLIYTPFPTTAVLLAPFPTPHQNSPETNRNACNAGSQNICIFCNDVRQNNIPILCDWIAEKRGDTWAIWDKLFVGQCVRTVL